jgi:secreted trypsin-like serine protease
VLTAAHCIQRTGQFTYQGATYTGDITPNAEYPTYGSMYTVYLGLHDKSALNAAPSVAMNVSSIRVHELYASSSYDNDIALLYLSKSATLSNYIQIACLPTASSSYYPGSSKICYAAGWGTLSSGGVTPDLLNNVRITTYPATSCSNVATLTSGQICAGLYSGGKDTCQGDSGGPLYNSDTVNSQNKFVVSGIVSYGVGCAQATYPGVYTRVSYYLDWINNQTSSSHNNSSDLSRINSSLVYVSVMVLAFFSV